MKLLQLIVLLHALFVTSLSAMDKTEDPIRLVFMGKTGAGKSTTLNAFYNFVKETPWDAYPKCFPLPTAYQPCNIPEYVDLNVEDHTLGQLGAVTQKPSEYVARGAQLVLSLIDCPGVADPRGIARDAEITEDIAEFLAGTDNFNAFCIVLHGNMNRATAEEKYAIEQIKTVIPKHALDRVFIVLTFVTRASQDVIDFAQSVGLPVDNIFAFDHFALSKEGYVNPNEDGEIGGEVEIKWGISKSSFDRLIAKAKSLGKYSTYEMNEICHLKNSISEKISAALGLIGEINDAIQRLDDAQTAYSRALREDEHASSAFGTASNALYQAENEKEHADRLSEYKGYSQAAGALCGNCSLVYVLDISNGYNYECSCGVSNFYFNMIGNIESIMLSAAIAFTTCSNEVATKKRLFEIKREERYEKELALKKLIALVPELKHQKDALQAQIIELYIEAEAVSMNSISLHIGEYYDVRIRATIDPLERAKLLNDKQLFIELIELYKQMKAG